MEFSYNNRNHSSIDMLPYQEFYGRPWRTPLSWDRIEDRVSIGPQLFKDMEQYVTLIRQQHWEAQDRQKRYANANKIDKQYMVCDRVFLRLWLDRSPIYYRKGSNLSPFFVGPFETLEWIRLVSCHLALSPILLYIHNVFHVYVLQKYIYDESHFID